MNVMSLNGKQSRPLSFPVISNKRKTHARAFGVGANQVELGCKFSSKSFIVPVKYSL
jgi:hypothetical protein